MTFIGQTQLPDRPDIMGVKMWYTGKNINATAGNRTANTSNLLVGDCLVLDPYGPEQGFGKDLANPTTAHLANPCWVVTGVPPASRLGGWIDAVPLAACRMGVPARTKANMTAGGTALALTNDTDGTANLRHLVATTTDPTTPILTFTPKAIAAETVDTSTTAAVKNVMPGQ